MPGTWFGLEIAKRGTMVHRTAMDVTGHNIANANTAGYTRQEAVIKPTDAWTLPSLETKMLPGQLGTGSEVESVRRIRDDYLDHQIRNSNSYAGYWQKKLDMANQTETVFLEPDGRGLQATMLDFFNDWQDLNNNPQDPGVKKAVKESADELANVFQQMHNQLTSITESSKNTQEHQIEQVNTIATRIAELSDTIAFVKKNGGEPNDLLDQRDNLLDELSTYGKIKISQGANYEQNYMIEVSFLNVSDSAPKLVKINGDKAEAYTLSLGSGEDFQLSLNIDRDGDGTFDEVDQSLSIPTITDEGANQGSIIGLESAKQETKEIINQLDAMAKSIIDQVNGKSGLTFFTGTGAADIELATAVKNNPEVIIGENALAVAQLSSTSIPIAQELTGTVDLSAGLDFGTDSAVSITNTKFTITTPDGTNHDISLSLTGNQSLDDIKAALQTALDADPQLLGKINVGDDGAGHLVLTANNEDETFTVTADAGNILFGKVDSAKVTTNKTTFESYFQSIVAEVGGNVKHHQNLLANQQAIGDQVETLRQSVSGVSLDEELAKVIQFQYGYQACARMISMQDEMLDYLINRIK